MGRTASWLLSCLAIGMTCASAVHAEPRSIQDFMSFQEKWPQLAKSSAPFQLEGRYAFFSAKEMRFANCPLRFILPENHPFRPGMSRVVEVTGRLLVQGNDPIFQISTIASRPDDLETLRIRRAAIDAARPEGWYQLADWAMERGTFYNDVVLKGEALSLREVGIEIERNALAADDYRGLIELARKAVGLGLSEEYSRGLRFTAFRKHYALLLQAPQPELAEFATYLRKELRGGNKILAAIPADRQARYQADPIGNYLNARPEERDLYDRLFVIEVELQRIERDARPDGSNGNIIADRIQSTIPERADLVEPYRQKELDFQVSRVGAMTRQEMLQLAQRFEDRQEPERALEVKRNWLTAREPGLRRERGRGLCDLAEDWITLVGDPEMARKFYMEAYRVDPGYPLSTVWLTNNGYVLHAGEWIPAAEAPPRGDEELQAAIRDGRVILGMNRSQVQAALGVAPSSVVRFPTREGLREVLIFQDAAVTVHLKAARPQSEPTVVEIGAIRTTLSR